MRSIRLNFSALRPVRFLVAACVCALLVFSYAFPAYSAPPVNPYGSSPSAPQKGEDKLLGIEEKAQEAAKEPPMSQRETEEKSKEGLNEIQGAADVEQMKRPESSEGANSVEQTLKNVLEKVTGKD